MISLAISVVKFFNYKINYDQYESIDENYPILYQLSLFSKMSYFNGNELKYALYFMGNTIVDLLNYTSFGIVCLAIDVWIAVKLCRINDSHKDVMSEELSKEHEEETTSVEQTKENVIKKI